MGYQSSEQLEVALDPTHLARASRWLGSWSPNFRVLMLFVAVSAVAMPVHDRFLSPFLRDSGIPVVWIGLFSGLVSTIAALSAPFAGTLTDALGRRSMLFAGRILRVSGLLLLFVIPAVPSLLVGATLLGLAQVANIGYTAITAESVPASHRSRAFAVLGAIRNIAGMSIPLVAGMLSDRIGVRTVLLLTLIPLFISALLCRKLSETASNSKHGTKIASRDKPPLHVALRFMMTREGRAAMLASTMWFVIGIEMGILGPVYSLYIRDRFDTGYSGLGAIAMLSGLGAALANLAGGKSGDTLGRAQSLMISFGLGAVVWAVVPYVSSAHVFAVLAFVTSFSMAFAEPSWDATCTGSVPKHIRGSIIGLYMACFALGQALGAPAGGLLYRYSISLPIRLISLTELLLLCLTFSGLRASLAGYSREHIAEDDD